MVVVPRVGTKVTMVTIGLFGNYVTVKGTVSREPKQHGFYKNGSWALTGGEGWRPCFKFGLREYRKKNPVIVRVDDVIKIDDWW